MADIDKIFKRETKNKLRTIIHKQFWDYLNVFDEDETNQSPPIRGEKINHEIELLKKKKDQRSLGARYTTCQKTNFWYWGKHWPNIWIKISFE